MLEQTIQISTYFFYSVGLNVNNFATSKDVLMKLCIQRALYYGSKWWKNHGIFLTIKVLFGPFSLRVPLLKIIPKSLVTLQFLKCLIFQIQANIWGFQMRYHLCQDSFWKVVKTAKTSDSKDCRKISFGHHCISFFFIHLVPWALQAKT